MSNYHNNGHNTSRYAVKQPHFEILIYCDLWYCSEEEKKIMNFWVVERATGLFLSFWNLCVCVWHVQNQFSSLAGSNSLIYFIYIILHKIFHIILILIFHVNEQTTNKSLSYPESRISGDC